MLLRRRATLVTTRKARFARSWSPSREVGFAAMCEVASESRNRCCFAGARLGYDAQSSLRAKLVAEPRGRIRHDVRGRERVSKPMLLRRREFWLRQRAVKRRAELASREFGRRGPSGASRRAWRR